MVRYINTKFKNQVETVDKLDSTDFKCYFEFKRELKRLVSEYSMAYNQYCYSSQRATKDY